MLTNEEKIEVIKKQSEKQLLQSIAYDMDAIREKVSVITTIVGIMLGITICSILFAIFTTLLTIR